MLAGVREGLRNKEIAGRLGMTDEGVRYHLKNIYRKTGASGRTDVLRHAQSLGAQVSRRRTGGERPREPHGVQRGHEAGGVRARRRALRVPAAMSLIAGWHAHRVRAPSEGGGDDLDNCEALCIPCHEAAEQVRALRAQHAAPRRTW